jgi:hypothetical protein
MAAAKQNNKVPNIHDLKPGSSVEDARKLAGTRDFGAKAGDADRVERDYVSGNTKKADPGHTQPMANEEIDGNRTAGVGGVDAGEGSSSGGDLDPDFVGLDGGGLSLSAAGDDDLGEAATDGTSAEFASGNPAHRADAREIGKVGGDHSVKGSTVTRPDARTLEGGADTATNSEGAIDNAFQGEVSSSEASGRDDRGE